MRVGERLSRSWQRDHINVIMKAHYQTVFKASYEVPNIAMYAQVLHCLVAAGVDDFSVHTGGSNLGTVPRAVSSYERGA